MAPVSLCVYEYNVRVQLNKFCKKIIQDNESMDIKCWKITKKRENKMIKAKY